MSRPGPEPLLRGRIDAFVTAATLPDRLDTFVALVRWTRPAAGDTGTLDELLNLLDDPRERRTFHAAISALIAETDGTNVFADAGIPTERAFPPNWANA